MHGKVLLPNLSLVAHKHVSKRDQRERGAGRKNTFPSPSGFFFLFFFLLQTHAIMANSTALQACKLSTVRITSQLNASFT